MQEYLESFANADAVAEECRRHGVKGRQCEPSDGPVARLAALRGVRLSVASRWFDHDDPELAWHDTPTAVHDFVARFDVGEYPDLVDNGSPVT